ncbi:MAG: hypothetical protein SF029_26335 [bacterium]|nr:hypothetical protein [bacterium]
MRRLLPLIAAAALALLFFHRLAFTDLILARGDTYAYFYPYWSARDTALNAALTGGQLPLWTPDLFMGVPLLANPQLGTFYPPNWLTMRLSPPDAVRVSVLLHGAWAMLGAFLLARRVVELGWISALLAGAVFAFGGFMGAHVEQINQFQGLAWMPWLFALFAPLAKANGSRKDKSTKGTEHLPHSDEQKKIAGDTFPLYLRERGIRGVRAQVFLLGAAWALQLLTGHTQTVFISGVGLGIYALVAMIEPQQRRAIRQDIVAFLPNLKRLTPLLMLFAASILAVVLALPQLAPTQKLASLSNRGGGLTQQQAGAFSLNPVLIGRGLLPSYDAQPFSEYVAYGGVIAFGLALVGAGVGRRALPWALLALAGVLLALGLYNPLYWPLASLPGFNLFRVPARWLALFALGVAMLAGLGLQHMSEKRLSWRRLGIISVVLLALMGSALLASRAADEIDGPALPTLRTWGGWLLALLVFIASQVSRQWLNSASDKKWSLDLWYSCRGDAPVARTQTDIESGYNLPDAPSKPTGYQKDRSTRGTEKGHPAPLVRLSVRQPDVLTSGGILPALLFIACLLELWLAAQYLPYNDLSDPAVYADTRFPIDLLRVMGEDDTPPGRLLSISGGLFDPGDRPRLEARWEAMGISERAARYAFTATKMQEVLAANLPLIYGIPSIDGYDGGLLPTLHYTAFSSLLLPQGALRTIDGRLRENLALSVCRGACLPDERWLDLTNTRYLLLDKVYDLVQDGIFYDTAFATPLEAGIPSTFPNVESFTGDTLHVLVVEGSAALSAQFSLEDGTAIALAPVDEVPVTLDGLTLLRFDAPEAAAPVDIVLEVAAATTVRALSLVDGRTGDFVQLTPEGWRRVYSAEVKIYENLDVMPRAFVVHQAQTFPDTWDGTEQALAAMRDPAFDPRQSVVLNRASAELTLTTEPPAEESTARIIAYDATSLTVEVQTRAPGYLVISDAYYPGWQATDAAGQRIPIERANVMFRAIPLSASDQPQTIRLRYEGLRQHRPAFIIGGVGWLLVAALITGLALMSRAPARDPDTTPGS